MADLKVSSEDLASFVALAEELAYDAGYRQGFADASAAMDAAMDEALAGEHAYQVSTLDPRAGEIVRRMVKAVTAAATPPRPPVTAEQLRALDRVNMHRGGLHLRQRDRLCSACAAEEVSA